MTNNNKIIYSNIKVPDKEEKVNPKKYHYSVRRAEILSLIEKAGSPKLISPTKLAKRYGVTHGQICQDITILKEEIKSFIGKDIKVNTHLTYQKVVEELLQGDNTDKFRAAKLMSEWNDWLFDIGEQNKIPESVEVRDVTDETIEESFNRFKKFKEKRNGKKTKK